MPAQLISPLQQAANSQQMQFAPWLNGATQLPQFWTSNGLPGQAIMTPNSIFIRSTQPDGTQSMFIQQHPQAPQQQPQVTQVQNQQSGQTAAQQTSNQSQTSAQSISATIQPQPQVQQHNIQTTTAKPRLLESITSKQQNRAQALMPQTSSQPTIRPASSVSTQTAQNQALIGQNKVKMRGKPQAVRPAITNMKNDAANQTKSVSPAATIQQMVTSAGNK